MNGFHAAYGLLIYMGIGLLYFLLTHHYFSWMDPWVYVTIALWPYFVFLFVLKWLFLIVVGGAISYFVYRAYFR